MKTNRAFSGFYVRYVGLGHLHAGFALGAALLVLFMAMAALERKWDRIKPLILTLGGCLAVIPFNPHGFRMFTYPLETLSSPAMQSLIQEWLSPDFHQFRFLPLAVLMLATFAPSPFRRSGSKQASSSHCWCSVLQHCAQVDIFPFLQFLRPTLAKYLLRWSASQTRLKFPCAPSH